MDKSKIYRQKAETFERKLRDSRVLFKRHMPSVGLVGEILLRELIQDTFPELGVAQGFVINKDNGGISGQCDIIIYDKKVNPRFYCGDLGVFMSDSVYAIIEVKTSIDKARFHSVLKSFKHLNKDICVNAPYILFVYDSISQRNIQNWLFSFEEQKNDLSKTFYASDKLKFDHGDEFWLPSAIISLEKSMHFFQNILVSEYGPDMFGYSHLELKCGKNIVNSIQEFLNFLDNLNNRLRRKKIIDYYNIDNYSYKGAFELFPI